MLISEWSGSTNRRFNSRGKARFFFQPLQFHLEPTDVLVKLFNQRFLALGFASTVGEDLLEALLSLLFPGSALMHGKEENQVRPPQ